MVKFILKLLFGIKDIKENVNHKEKVVKRNCANCHFNNKKKDKCWAGSFYSSKGRNVVCYEGEIWQKRISKS